MFLVGNSYFCDKWTKPKNNYVNGHVKALSRLKFLIMAKHAVTEFRTSYLKVIKKIVNRL